MPTIDWDSLSFDEFVQLRDELSRQMRRRFEREIALVFTDVVDSTVYFERHGDVAGHALLHRHESLLRQVLEPRGGRIVDTAGDGAFCVLDSAQAAAIALVEFQEALAKDNAGVPPQHRFAVRCGLHWGAALVSETAVRGDAVNFCARVAGSATGGEIRLSRDAFNALPTLLRARCQQLPPIALKGIAEPATLMVLDWRDPARFPTTAVINETGAEIPLPCQNRITFGRLAEHEGRRANDVVLSLPDPAQCQRISRWHFELELSPDGFLVRPLSPASTMVDGQPVPQGETALIRPGSVVQLSGVLTISFAVAQQGSSSTIFDG
jgi:class 3 adenylate cyclase